MRVTTRNLCIVSVLLSLITVNLVFLAHRAATLSVQERSRMFPLSKVMQHKARHPHKVHLATLRHRLVYITGHRQTSLAKKIILKKL